MDPKKLPKETYSVPELELSEALLLGPLAASVGGGSTEDLTTEEWTI